MQKKPPGPYRAGGWRGRSAHEADPAVGAKPPALGASRTVSAGSAAGPEPADVRLNSRPVEVKVERLASHLAPVCSPFVAPGQPSRRQRPRHRSGHPPQEQREGPASRLRQDPRQGIRTFQRCRWTGVLEWRSLRNRIYSYLSLVKFSLIGECLLLILPVTMGVHAPILSIIGNLMTRTERSCTVVALLKLSAPKAKRQFTVASRPERPSAEPSGASAR